MSNESENVANAAKLAVSEELGSARDKLHHCVNQLSDEQLWWRSSDSMNSIANLLLHLCGNLQQWIISGVGGVEDTRNRPQEFADRSKLPKAALMNQLDNVVAQARQTIEQAADENLTQVRIVQTCNVTGFSAIIQSVAHFRGHTQEIVYLTRTILGNDYQFDFVPKTPEEGAPRS